LDTPPEDAFDRIVDLATHLFDAPTALVSLIDRDADRQWFKACIGMDEKETGLDVSFCIYAVQQAAPLVIEDAAADERFCDNPLVTGAPGIRFYAGAPLITPTGDPIGTVCVIDTEPRTGDAAPSDAQIHQLQNLASMVIDELELRREATRRRRSEQRFQDVARASGEYVWEVDADGCYTYVTEQAEAVKGRSTETLLGRSPLEWMPDGDVDQTREALSKARAEGSSFTLEHRNVLPDGSVRTELVSGLPLFDDEGAFVGFRGTGRDITERRQAEQTLRAVKEEYETVLQGAQDAIFAVDVETDESGSPRFRIRWINESHTEQTGLVADEVCGMRPRDILGDDAAEVEARYRECVDARSSISYEETLTLPEGTKTWFTKLSPVIRDGEVQQLVGVARDITARKEAEETLREREEQLRTINENVTDGIYRTVRGRGLTYANQALADMFGYDTPQALLQVDPESLYASAAARKRLFDQSERDGGFDAVEVEFRRRDGSAFTGLMSSTVIEHEDEPPCHVGAVTDITKRKQAEDKLRKSEAQIRGLANSVPGVIFRFYVRPAPGAANDAENAYGVSFVSEQAEEVLGLAPTPKGFLERFLEHVPDAHRADFMRSIRDAVAQGDEWSFETPFDHPDGRTMWVRGRSAPESRGETITWNGVLLDITEQKALERQLRHAQKMETVGTLAGGIAHDFNNILHATGTYLELLRDAVPEDTPDRMILDRAFTGLGRAEGLVDKLLAFSRQEIKTTEEPVDMADVITETLALAEPSVPGDVQLRAATPDECIVQGDPAQLRQVAMNLITNAAQALDEADAPEQEDKLRSESATVEKVLDVAVRRTHVGQDLADQYLHLTPGPYVRMTVSDSGPGMEADTKARIFEPFFTTKDVDKGTGLGLSVVHGIVQAHGGEVNVHSQPGEGTTFHVYLPSADATAMDADDADADASDARPRILLVDDDEQVRSLEETRLSGLGYDVTTMNHAEAALQHLRDHDVDIVITDYLMPEMNGLELIEALRGEGHTAPVLVMSGFSARVSEDQVRAAGAAEFLRKPVGRRELKDALSRAQAAEKKDGGLP